jgi:uncharacterized protein (DUF2336 family)
VTDEGRRVQELEQLLRVAEKDRDVLQATLEDLEQQHYKTISALAELRRRTAEDSDPDGVNRGVREPHPDTQGVNDEQSESRG